MKRKSSREYKINYHFNKNNGIELNKILEISFKEYIRKTKKLDDLQKHKVLV